MAFTLNDITNLVQGAGGLWASFQGSQYESDGYNLAGSNAIAAGDYAANLAIQGGVLSASAYRQAGRAAMVTANYNIALNKVALQKQETALTRELSAILNSNRALVGGTGISLSSKSNLAIMSANIHRAESAVLQYRNTATQQQLGIAYQGQLAGTQYENQARMAEYNSKLAAQKSQFEAQITKSSYDYKAEGASGKGKAELLSGALKLGTTLLGEFA